MGDLVRLAIYGGLPSGAGLSLYIVGMHLSGNEPAKSPRSGSTRLDRVFGSCVLVLGVLILLIAIGYSVLAYNVTRQIPIWYDLMHVTDTGGQYFLGHLILQTTVISIIAAPLVIWSGNSIFRPGKPAVSGHEPSRHGNVVTIADSQRLRRLLYGLLAASGVLLTLTSGLCTVYTGGEFLAQLQHYTGGPGDGGYAFGLAPIFINAGTMLILCGVAIYSGGRALLQRPWPGNERTPGHNDKR